MQPAASLAVSLVLEMNFFTTLGLQQLLSAFLHWQSSPLAHLRSLHLKRLRCHMNRLDDSCGAALAQYMGSCLSNAYLPSEVHLSHNRLSTAGASALLEASARLYPRLAGPGRQPVPLWLRMEHNTIDVPALRARAAELGLRYCTCVAAAGGDGRGGRGRGASRGRGGRGGAASGSGGPRCGAALCLVNVQRHAQ